MGASVGMSSTSASTAWNASPKTLLDARQGDYDSLGVPPTSSPPSTVMVWPLT